jgi:parvulin-like peptidyl-prolyl isomerase
MKKAFVLLTVLTIMVFITACGTKSPDAPFEQGSDQYTFFKTLSDSLGYTYLNPEKATALITTKDFSVWTFDIMPGLYARFSRFQSDPSKIPADQMKSLLTQGAEGEAQKKLLLLKAEKAGVSASDSTVNEQLEKYYASRGGEEAFIKLVEQQGFTIDFVKADIRDQMTVQNFLDKELEPKMAINDEDLQTAYGNDKTATVQHILFMTQGKSDEEKAEIRKKAEEVLARAKANEDFGALAKEFSEDPGSKEKGGLYEDFGRGRMVKSFEDASFTLPLGSISDLVDTVYGVHIIKVIERKKETRPFDEIKEELRGQIEQTKRRDVFEGYLEEIKEESNYQEHFEIFG